MMMFSRAMLGHPVRSCRRGRPILAPVRKRGQGGVGDEDRQDEQSNGA
jgi:hypothetical protein